jgi:H+/Cl- antiporter ClcA
VTLSGPGVLGEAFGKTALVIGIIIAVVLLIIFFYFIVSGVIGGVIGYLFYWLNQKRSLIKIADHWIFIIAIVLTIIFVVIGRLVFSPANYIAAVLIGFIIGYWIRKKLEEED